MQPANKTGFLWHEIYMWHDTGTFCGCEKPSATVQPAYHYENPESKRRIRNLLEVTGLLEQLTPLTAMPVTRDDLARIHTNAYLDRIESMRGIGGYADPETPLGIASVDIAEKAVGGAIAATKAVMQGEVDNAYALMRPPGHHAEPDNTTGFCVFANAAIAGAYALEHLGAKRVAYIDWDVHHGNGTESCFIDNPNALTISIHQADWFPRNRGHFDDIGTGDGVGKNMNIPLMPGCGHGAYLYAFEQIIIPALDAYQPDLIFVPCGFDASIEDPLGRMMLTEDSYREMTAMLMQVADKVCNGRLVFTHEGGYNPFTTPFLGLAVIETLCGYKTGAQSPNLEMRRDVGYQALQSYQKALIDEIRDFFQQAQGCPLNPAAAAQ
ncbi:class II histone deacetylase [Cardiobacteriales bacterium ML27]|uniref:Class II histone deacetylase n=2 Tax=Ostreibacterium oceani TaxID=2654998 RepID=A0A6N7EYJ5_9GAMM|nr:class II histone deacetylase [Ostreibacterium oceani]